MTHSPISFNKSNFSISKRFSLVWSDVLRLNPFMPFVALILLSIALAIFNKVHTGIKSLILIRCPRKLQDTISGLRTLVLGINHGDVP